MRGDRDFRAACGSRVVPDPTYVRDGRRELERFPPAIRPSMHTSELGPEK